MPLVLLPNQKKKKKKLLCLFFISSVVKKKKGLPSLALFREPLVHAQSWTWDCTCLCLLDRACLVMLSSSSWDVPPPPLYPSSQASQRRLNSNRGGRGTGQITQPCNVLMSCHAVRLRQIINLDHLSCHNIDGGFRRGPREKPSPDCR